MKRFHISSVLSTNLKPMKRITLLFLLLPLMGWSIAPEKILPKTLELKPLEWYSQQAKAWSEEVRRDPHNKESWITYYAASYFSQSSKASLQQIIKSMEEAIPLLNYLRL